MPTLTPSPSLAQLPLPGWLRGLYWSCLFLLVPGMLLRLPVGGAGVLLVDLYAPVVLGLWGLYRFSFHRQWPSLPLVAPVLLFCLLGTASLFLRAGDVLTPSTLALSWFFVVRLLYFTGFALFSYDLFARPPYGPQRFLRGLSLIAGLVLLGGVIQFYLYPDLSAISKEGQWDPHIGRLLGTWMDPNFIGGFIGLLLPVWCGWWYDSLHLHTTKVPHQLPRLVLFLPALLGLGALCLFLTYSRSGYLAALVGLAVFFLVRDRRMLFIGALIVSLAITATPRVQQRLLQLSGTVKALILRDTDEIDPTASLRLQSWRRSLRLGAQRPLLGVGYNSYRYHAADAGIVDGNYFSSGGSDSTLLTVFVTTGLLGLSVFLWLLWRLWWGAFVGYLSRQSSVSLGLSCGLLSLLVHSQFVNSLLYPFITLTLFSLAGALTPNPLNS